MISFLLKLKFSISGRKPWTIVRRFLSALINVTSLDVGLSIVWKLGEAEFRTDVFPSKP